MCEPVVRRARARCAFHRSLSPDTSVERWWQVAKEVPAAAALYEKASEILGYDLLAKCAGDKAELDTTTVSQPAIFVSSLVRLSRSLSISLLTP